jgi:hypothetical protein
VTEGAIDRGDRPSRRDGVLAQQADDELVLLDVEAGTYFALNEVGAKVWELCDGARTVEQLLEIIGEEFDAPGDVIERDVRGLLEDLGSDRLVVW